MCHFMGLSPIQMFVINQNIGKYGDITVFLTEVGDYGCGGSGSSGGGGSSAKLGSENEL